MTCPECNGAILLRCYICSGSGDYKGGECGNCDGIGFYTCEGSGTVRDNEDENESKARPSIIH